ncbi:S9 family peptidase [Butyricimonas synergistica]|uniref:S9 family peptidase n=1 Tax=Butyricimonas synergistica TaxID=544644 RepID=UPI00037DEC19|nr:DPP IV N-terminal domain-containing protein [Butyricimonas synergistica]
MIKFFTCSLFCFFVLTGVCQKANYKQAEKFMKMDTRALVGSTSVAPNYLKKSDKFWYSYRKADGVRYFFVDPKAKSQRELFDRDFMAAEISKVTHKPVNKQELPISGITFKDDERTMKFMVDTFRFEYNINTGRLVKIDSARKKPTPPAPRKKTGLFGTYSPDSSYIVYAKSHNLYMLRVKDSVETQLTTDGEIKYSYASSGTDTSTARRDARVTWFENSERFYVRRTDRRKIKSLYLVNNLSSRPTLSEYEYVMAGDENVQQEELYLFDTLNKKQIKVPVEKWKDQTIRLFTPGKKVERLYFLRKKRTCDEIDFCRVNPETGEVKVLFSEIDKPYFNNEFFNLSLLNDGEDIIWWSERTGHGHFYHYDGEGNLKNTISSGAWTAGKLIKIDTVGRTIYFEGYGQVKGECPYFARINKARIDGNGQVEMLTPEQATHEAVFSGSGRYFVDNYSRVDLEPKSVLRDNKGKKILDLASPDLAALYATGWRMPEPFTLKAADGVTDLYGYMWKPADFDSTKTYPIISYVYPGPQTEAIPLKFSIKAAYNTALAQVGFVVVTFGHRGGSPLRDKWYHTFGHGNLRDYPLADDKCGIEQLAERYPFIDKSKVGIFGHSGGGFMSTAAICTYPDFYTAAVSSAGNHDNNIYNQWWGETHHGVNEVKSFEKKTVKDSVTGKDSTITEEKVKFTSRIPTNIELAKNLKGYLMLVTGDSDNNVHPANTIRMADALLRAGKNFDLVILPGQRHGFQGMPQEFYQRKMWFHFGKYLLGDFSSDKFREIDAFMRL